MGVSVPPSLWDEHIPIRFTPSNPLAQVPSPQAAALPVSTPPSLMDRVRHTAAHVRDTLMPANGMAGLLGSDDLASARQQGLLTMGLDMLAQSRGAPGQYAPGLGQAVASSAQAGMGAFQNAAQRTVAANQLQQQLDEQQRLKFVRGQIAKAYPPAPNETPQQQVQRLMQMYTAYAQAGDEQMAGKLGEVLKSMGDVLNGPKPVDVQHVDAGDHVEVIDARSGKTLRTIPKGPVPKTAAEVDATKRFNAEQTNKVLDDFRSDSKDFDKVMQGWDVLNGAVKNPNLTTPFAITDAYARITNPGAIVRPTTMEMIRDMGSLGQRMQKAWDHSVNGQLPPDIVKDFQRTLYNIVKEHKAHYDDVRSKAILRAQKEGVDITPLISNYNLVDPLEAVAPQPGAKGNAGNVRQFVKP